MPGCLSSVPQEPINNCRLRSLVLHRKAENDSHLGACPALSMPFCIQRHTGLKQASACHLCEQKRKVAASLPSKAGKETSQLPSVSVLCPCLWMLQPYSVVTVLQEPSQSNVSKRQLPSLLSFTSQPPH